MANPVENNNTMEPTIQEQPLDRYMEEAYRIAGGKNPRGRHTKCMARGDEYCLFEYEWD